MNISPFTPQQTASYLRTLPAIRERCTRVHELAKQGKLQYFDYHPEQEDAVASFCLDLMKRDFGSNFSSIPPHGRWRHLDAGHPRVEPLIAKWNTSPNPPDTKEVCRRLVDLFLVSVLLDAGAGNTWKYVEPQSGQSFSRSEGLGVASINMFEEGFFSGNPQNPYQVDAEGLSRISTENTTRAMQVTSSNPMVGIEGRTALLQNLSTALKASPVFFGADARPGNLVDFLESESILDGSTRRVPVAALWAALIDGLTPIWPATRSTLGGVPLGDCWPCEALKPAAVAEGDELVPFHKLTGWITYSLLEPLEKVLKWRFEGVEDMTGLPEYRNAIVEWRAMTVIELDRIANSIRSKLGLTREQLTLAQVLESATWKGGREIAKQKRPATGGPPIEIESDGTVF
ncbi:hypothetical protein EW026_g5557 [Hermanssonia centrifuga]|uniref:DUF1688-domain-containing protein n=1 Tax=Hermanssonia centrifuga TaxID=98765 RepID=A0A4S4KI53_9APHY|nr:hypothetical protein EW026_g5557 [Hermanssonia centrifuga]